MRIALVASAMLIGAAALTALQPEENWRVWGGPRRVYAAVLADWLGLPERAALGAGFERWPLFVG